MSESIPKAFISYSWSSADRVLELAKRLVSDGVDIVLDKWELKEGQDKYVFMERSVTDPTIGKVLMICDESYAEKANKREGGVGDETMVISPGIYGKTAESKYIPIIFERDSDGKEYRPAYLKARIYIDLCEDNPQYEKEYEKLLRNLHSKPEHSKPALGKMPEWLNDETVEMSGIRSLLKQFQSADGSNKSKTEYIIRRFCDEFIQTTLQFAPKVDKDFDNKLLVQIDSVKPLRDLFFDYIEALIASDSDTGAIIGDFFELLYNGTHSRLGQRTCSDSEFEFHQFLIWEMFIGTTALLLHYERYMEINKLLYRTYFVLKTPLGSALEAVNYAKFRPYLSHLENVIKPKSETPNRFTIAGDIAVNREKPPLITRLSLVDADLVLYQLSCVLLFSDDIAHITWFPKLYVYAEESYSYRQPIWNKMTSRKHCEKLMPLFGVSDIKDLTEIVERNKPADNMHYLGSFDSPSTILQSVSAKSIGTMP